jgi:hypothetical protein
LCGVAAGKEEEEKNLKERRFIEEDSEEKGSSDRFRFTGLKREYWYCLCE